MYYKCFLSKAFLIHSIIRFSHIILEKERLFEVFNLAHSYSRWEIKAQRDETTFPESKLLPVPILLSLHPDFTASPVTLIRSSFVF